MTDDIQRLRGIEQFAAEASRHERDGLRAEIERLRAELASIRGLPRLAAFDAEIMRLRAALRAIECDSIDHTDACRLAGRALEPKP